MPERFGLIYEVTHDLSPEIVEDFDAWLGRHIKEMLELPGLSKASTFTTDNGDDSRPRRVTHYYFDSDADLAQYLAGPAAAMRSIAVEKFGDKFDVSRRTLHETDVIDGRLKPSQACLNCGTTLSGQYCGSCGQRARSRLISIWELMQEAFGDLLELDSRLWRTLIPLAIRPGKLTRDYLEGRRARFMPPFRTYLVLSIFFFLIAFFDPQQEFSILFEPEAEVPAEAADDERAAEAVREEILNELVEEGLLSADQAGLQPEDGGGAGEETTDAPDDFNLRIGSGSADTDEQCNDVNVGDVPDWIGTRLTEERLKAVCKRVVADDGKAFLGKLLDNVPAALFILLPLMAFVLKVLYPLTKRYYVEHLLFVVHVHAFIFLILSLQIILLRVSELLNMPDGIAAATTFAVSVYIPVYLYKGMRRVYEQGHFLTTSKFLVLTTAYLAGLAFIFVFAALFAAFSI